MPLLQLPADVRPTHYALELTIDPDAKRFAGTARIDIRLEGPRQVLWLHGLDLEVSSAAVLTPGGRVDATWTQVNDDGVVRLVPASAIPAGSATLEIVYERTFDPGLVGLYLSPEAGRNYAFTQFEDIFARRAFPGFDQPGFKTPFDVTLVVPAEQVAVANTAAVEEAPFAHGMKRIRYATTRPLPTYLLAWAVGPFDVVDGPLLPPNRSRSTSVPLRGIAAKGRGRELESGLKDAAELLLLEEEYFGVPFAYPKLDSVAVPDYAYGAMENAGEIHYREDTFLYTEGVSALDTKIEADDTIAHEQAHQWFGDLVTMPWWDEAWLNESFATWFATRTVGQWKPEWRMDLRLQRSATRAMENDALSTARAIRQPVTNVKNISDQFDGLTYQKGGAVLAMFERYVGEEKFRAGIRAYIAGHADGSGSTDDLLQALSAAAGAEIAPAFKSFLDQAGVPLVKASVSCAGKPTVTLEQSRYAPLGATPSAASSEPQRWGIPICLRLGGIGGKASEQCLLLTDRTKQLELERCPTWVMPNANGSGYYLWSLSREDLGKLLGSGYASLTVRERLSLAAALHAAVRAGAIPVADALSVLEPIARDLDSDVSREGFSLLEEARERIVPTADVPKVDAYTRVLYAPVQKRLGFRGKKGEASADRELRRRLLRVLGRADEPKVVAELTRQARAYVGLSDQKLHPEAVDPDLAGTALAVAIEHGDAALFDAVEALLKTIDDSELRERLVGALSSARDEAHSTRALGLILSGVLRKQETTTVLFEQGGDRRTRERAWTFLKANADAVLARTPPFIAAYLPYLTADFCDQARDAEAQAFFEPRTAATPGLELRLRQSQESSRVCRAVAAAQRESAAAFFEARSPKR